jgi:hypothetical protein
LAEQCLLRAGRRSRGSPAGRSRRRRPFKPRGVRFAPCSRRR